LFIPLIHGKKIKKKELTSIMNKDLEKDLLNILEHIKEVLDHHNIEFWLDCGTLLGAVRENKFISWENDLDFGVMSEAIPTSKMILVSEALNAQGYSVWIAENHINIRHSGERAYADINIYRKQNGFAVKPTRVATNWIGKKLSSWLPLLWDPIHHRLARNMGVNKRIFYYSSLLLPTIVRDHIAKVVFSFYKYYGSKSCDWIVPLKFFIELKPITFYGMNFKEPTAVEDYLEYRYGKDWQTPREEWITAEEDGAAKQG
jgi:hypothetical protein